MNPETEIVNRVEKSGLITIDLQKLLPLEERVEIDIAQWLDNGIILREKEYREAIKNHNWENYQNKYVAVNCYSDAIIPFWSYMLVISELTGKAKLSIQGSLSDLEKEIIRLTIQQIDAEEYKDERIIIKGCSDIHHPEYAFSLMVSKLQPYVKSIMYGEPCSTVPVFKKR